MKNKSLLLILCVLSSALMAQEGKAKKHYDGYSYTRAIEKYEAIEVKTEDVHRKLATSYNKIGNTKKAEYYYMHLLTMKEAQPEDMYNYAAVLRSNGKYHESEVWMEKYNKLVPHDSRGEQHINQSGTYNQLKKDEGKYSIKHLSINSEQEDFGAAYYINKIVFSSSREGITAVTRRWNWNQLPFLDLYEASLNDDGELSNLTVFDDKVNAKFHDGPAVFSVDGKYMLLSRNNNEKSDDGTVNLKLSFSTFENEQWTEPEPFPFNSNNYSVGHPALSNDGSVMYFASDMPGGHGGVDIYKVMRDESDNWGKPVNMGKKINTEGDEMFPFIHDEGYLFFASNGHVGLGGLDVFMAQVKGKSISEVNNLGYPINDKQDDFAFIINPDLTSGFFSSNREGGMGDDDLYSFKVLKPFSNKKIIKGEVKDQGGKVLPNAVISLYDNTGKIIDSVKADNKGQYSFTATADNDYNLKGTKVKYFPNEKAASTKTDEEEVIVNLELEIDPGISLFCLVTDKETKKALSGVQVTLTNNMEGASKMYETGQTGSFTKPLNGSKLKDRISFNLKLEMEGYMSKTLTYNKLLDKEGQYDVHTELDLSMDKIDVGMDLATIIDIQPIYFDLGKYAIRPDAALELDKIIAVMNDNPKMEVELGSHTDCRGSAASNEKLSDKRANSSAAYIKGKITSPDRISGKGYGETLIINKCECEGATKVNCSEAEHQENRRTEFKILKM